MYGAGKISAKAVNGSRSDPALSDLVEQFLDDPSSNRGEKAGNDYRVVLRYLSEFVDPAAPVSLIGREHCRTVVALLRRVQPLERVTDQSLSTQRRCPVGRRGSASGVEE